MKTSILIAFLSVSISASAQFFTIAPGYRESTKNQVRDTIPAPKDSLSTIENIPEDVESSNIQWCHPPLKGKLHISSRFGKRRNPFGKKSSEHHSGLDLSAKAGTPIFAMLPGEVIHIGYDSRSGNYIKLQHGGFTISYCHLIRKPSIPIGTKILPGQTVAHVGSTGRSTGPHLHITLKRNGRVLDPAILLDYLSEFSSSFVQ